MVEEPFYRATGELSACYIRVAKKQGRSALRKLGAMRREPPLGCPRPELQRSDWVRALQVQGEGCWMLAPSSQMPMHAPDIVNWEVLYLGPVHEVDQTPLFAAVLVPHPQERDLLVWVNVWTSKNMQHEWRGVRFYEVVPERVLAEWASNGWENVFLSPEHPCVV